MNIDSAFQDVRIVGLPWYEPETFGECMALMSDRERLFKRYEDWLRAALNTERNIKAMGKTTIRAVIQPEAFAAWCKLHRPGLDIDSEARTHFANQIAKNHATGH